MSPSRAVTGVLEAMNLEGKLERLEELYGGMEFNCSSESPISIQVIHRKTEYGLEVIFGLSINMGLSIPAKVAVSKAVHKYQDIHSKDFDPDLAVLDETQQALTSLLHLVLGEVKIPALAKTVQFNPLFWPLREEK